MQLRLGYDPNRFTTRMAGQLLDHLTALLRQMTAGDDPVLADLSLHAEGGEVSGLISSPSWDPSAFGTDAEDVPVALLDDLIRNLQEATGGDPR